MMSYARVRSPFLDGLRTKIEPIPLSLRYRAALGIVACAMVLLPLIYLTLIGLVIWGVVWFAMNGWPLLAGLDSRKFRVALFVTPLIVGVTVVIFLVKPLFFRQKRHSDEVRLEPADEEALFDFVRRTARSIGAPEPREIRLDNSVNASASFRRGVLSLFFDDLVLTIGVPLAAGLTLEQLAGVLAHEFGHFGQRAGMRLSYVIRSVNHWFARVVYERDRFDAYLEHTEERSDSLEIHAITSIASFCIRMSRALLEKLMHLGNVISSSLLRQMEYDADGYAVRLVGRNVHASILRDLFLLSRVYEISLSAAPNQHRQGTLTDSLATLMQANRRRLAVGLDEAYRKHLAQERTHSFDTHPTNSERIAKGLSGPGEGVFASELPASVLFRDFAGLERARSRSLFESFLGPLSPEAFVPVEHARAELDEAQRDLDAAERYLPGGTSVLRPLPLPGVLPSLESRKVLQRAVTAVKADREASAAAARRFEELHHRRADASRAAMLLTLGLPIQAASFGLDRADFESAREVEETASRQLEELALQRAPMESNAVRRMTLALALLEQPDAARERAEPAAWRRQVPRLLAAEARLRQVLPLLIRLQETRVLLLLLESADAAGKLAGPVVSPIMNLAQQGHGQLAELLRHLEGAEDPFSDKPVLLTRIAAPDGLPPAQTGPVLQTIGATGVLLELHDRIVGRLCRIAEGMETLLVP